MMPSCVAWSVTILNISCPSPPTMLYPMSAFWPTSASSALIRPIAPPISADSKVVRRNVSKENKRKKKSSIPELLCHGVLSECLCLFSVCSSTSLETNQAYVYWFIWENFSYSELLLLLWPFVQHLFWHWFWDFIKMFRSYYKKKM